MTTPLYSMPGLHPLGIFVFLCWLFAVAPAAADCQPQQRLQRAKVAAVVDGDTLRLANGRRLRLLSVNAPELGRDGAADDAFARAAKQALDTLIGDAGWVYWHGHGKDRYGRSLASVFATAEGAHLGEALLAKGLAWHIAVPPSPQPYRDCLREAEAQARSRQQGVWSQAPVATTGLTRRQQGFQRLRGRLLAVDETGSALWLRLEGDVVLRLSRQDRQYFPVSPQQWLGQQLEVRGWLRWRRPPRPGLASFTMDLRHPDMWRCMDCD